MHSKDLFYSVEFLVIEQGSVSNKIHNQDVLVTGKKTKLKLPPKIHCE